VNAHPELDSWAVALGEEPLPPTVEAHLRGCASCAAEFVRLRAAAGLLGATTAQEPPARLRGRIMATALAYRPTRERLIEPYARQVTALHGLLSELDIRQLARPEPHYGDVDGVLTHLTRNDNLVASDLGLVQADLGAVRTGAREAWRGQAVSLLRGVEMSAPLDRPVRMAGRAGLRRPLRDALVQRTFETWIHADDIRRAVDRPPAAPPAEDVSLIVALGLRLLPVAMRALGCEHPGRSASLRLGGATPLQWRVPLSMDADPGDEVVCVTADAVGFCELMANRRSLDRFVYQMEGDAAAARDLLRAAATLGCD